MWAPHVTEVACPFSKSHFPEGLASHVHGELPPTHTVCRVVQHQEGLAVSISSCQVGREA